MENMQPGSYIYENISLRQGEDQEGIDDEWCAMITEAYREKNYRTVLQAAHFYVRDYGDCNRPVKAIKYEEVLLADPDGEGLILDGRLVGARLLPFRKTNEDGVEYWQKIPYAIMSDVAVLAMNETEAPEPLTDDPGECLLVPLTHSGNTLALYSVEGIESALELP